MIITVDGYDGTGKTTLAKNIERAKDFYYIEKPFILKYQEENDCTYEEAKYKTEIIEKKLFSQMNKNDIIKYYSDALVWLKKFQNEKNIILDRGILTLYAVVGDKKNLRLFKHYIREGAFFDYSIYLTANDFERRKRIYTNDPNDPDLKYPIEWRKNDLEEFANNQKLDYFKIVTDDKTPDEVADIANKFLDENIEKYYYEKQSLTGNGKVLIKKLK